MGNTAAAKPGSTVNIIFTLDIEKETADVGGSIIYDITGMRYHLVSNESTYYGKAYRKKYLGDVFDQRKK
jgi:hypothetical protein